jgi:hypothetical protein
VSQTPDGSNHLEWKMNPNSKNDKRKDDDGKNGKDPDCTECIPSTDKDMIKLLRLMEELSDLLEIIRLNIHEHGLVPQNERVTLFQRLIALLEPLIHEHGAVFERNEEGIKLIPFRVNQMVQVTWERPPIIILDREIQDFFENMVTIFSTENRNLESNLDFKGIIYCIQCLLCRRFIEEFNYVGQSVNSMNDRAKLHFSLIKRNVAHLLHLHLLNEHKINESEITKDFLPHAYIIYLIHNLSDNATSPRAPPSCKRRRDARIRRAWEMFYQWAFKAMHFDGGGSTR